MSKITTKQETELRVDNADELFVAAKYGISWRRARQITSSAYVLLKDDIKKGDLNRPEMTAKSLCTLETCYA